VKDNIILSKPFNEKKFADAIAASGLGLDVGIWTDGIDTNVGEGGSRLSGGQKARVGLAMCIYQEPEIFLLDDPIAALDAKLAKFVMEETLIKRLAGKTRVVVTHSTQFLKLADYVYVMHQGRIVRKGTYQELYEDKLIKKISELSLQREMSLRRTESFKVQQEIESPSLGNDADLAGRLIRKFSNSKHVHSRKSSLANRKVSFDKERRASKAWSETENLADTDENQVFVNKYFKEECQESETGHVSWATVKTLIQQSGGLLTIVFIIVMCQVGALVEMYYFQYIISWTRAFVPETQWHSLQILFWIGFGWATMVIIKCGFTSFLTVH
jgi:ABC-type bacteriocin/lantibiotic exporter with double-glycine peptidase domain